MKRAVLATTLLATTLALSCKDDAKTTDAGAGPVDASAADGGGVVLDDAGAPVDGSVVTRPDVLASMAACVSRTYRDALAQATALEAATATLVATPTPEALAAARDAYRATMGAWQIAELMQIGPAGPPPPVQPGGQGLRDEIYAWPFDSRCAVEEQLVSRGYESAGFPTSLFNRRGLAAIEYLLFYEGADTACPATSTIVSSGSWAALTPDERGARKRTYAAKAASAVRARVAELVDAWDPAKGGFQTTLANPSASNAVYKTTQAAFNALSDAVFYLDTEVKDMKVAKPVGVRDCMTPTCPEAVESRFAALSKANVRANLVGFRRIFEGCGADFVGLGFDDLLYAVGAEPLATTMKQALAGANAALDAIEEPDLVAALATDPASVRAFYDAIKALTDRLKVDFINVLDLEVAMSAEGDND